MSLTDIVSGLDSTLATQIGLVLFLATYAAILLRLSRSSERGALTHAAALPLSDAPIVRDTTRTTGASVPHGPQA